MNKKKRRIYNGIVLLLVTRITKTKGNWNQFSRSKGKKIYMIVDCFSEEEEVRRILKGLRSVWRLMKMGDMTWKILFILWNHYNNYQIVHQSSSEKSLVRVKWRWRRERINQGDNTISLIKVRVYLRELKWKKRVNIRSNQLIVKK